MPKLRILHLITTIERGGAENQLLVLIKEQILQGHEVSVLPLKGNLELADQINQIGAILIDGLIGKSFLYQILKLRNLNRGLIDVIHSHLPRAEIVAFIMKGRHKFLISRHNAEAFFPGKPKFLSSGLSRIVTRRASHVVAISKAVMDFLTLQDELSRRTTCSIIHYGFPLSSREFPISKKELRTKFNLEDDLFLVGTIARLTKQKNLETLLMSFKLVSHELNAKLIIVGDGEDRSSLEILSVKLEISSDIVWVGRTGDVSQYLNLMDVFCLTSHYEGFGLVLLEAMAHNIPIVASNISAIPEVLSTSHPGLATPGNPQDFANRILNLRDPKMRADSISIGRLQLLSFDATKMANCIQNIYIS